MDHWVKCHRCKNYIASVGWEFDKKIYCQPCAKQKVPQCANCPRLIDGPARKVDSEIYHPQHFGCDVCTRPFNVGDPVNMVELMDGIIPYMSNTCNNCVGYVIDAVPTDISGRKPSITQVLVQPYESVRRLNVKIINKGGKKKDAYLPSVIKKYNVEPRIYIKGARQSHHSMVSNPPVPASERHSSLIPLAQPVGGGGSRQPSRTSSAASNTDVTLQNCSNCGIGIATNPDSAGRALCSNCAPNCARCGKKLEGRSVVVYNELDEKFMFHVGCFNCVKCGKTATDSEFLVRLDGQPKHTQDCK